MLELIDLESLEDSLRQEAAYTHAVFLESADTSLPLTEAVDADQDELLDDEFEVPATPDVR